MRPEGPGDEYLPNEQLQLEEVTHLLESDDIRKSLETLLEGNEFGKRLIVPADLLEACQRRLHHRIKAIGPIKGDLRLAVDDAIADLADKEAQDQRILEVDEVLSSMSGYAEGLARKRELPGVCNQGEILGAVRLTMIALIRKQGEVGAENLEAYLRGSVSNLVSTFVRTEASRRHDPPPGADDDLVAAWFEGLLERRDRLARDAQPDARQPGGWETLRLKLGKAGLKPEDLAILDYVFERLQGAPPGTFPKPTGETVDVTVLRPGGSRTLVDSLIYEALQIREHQKLEREGPQIPQWWRDQKRFFTSRVEKCIERGLPSRRGG